MTEDRFAMVSEWMTNGNINQFVMVHRDANRFELVSCPFRPLRPSHTSRPVGNHMLPQLCDVARGLIYMHGQGMVHGDLKGVRLIKLRPRLSL